MDNGVRKHGNDQTDDGVKDGVFRIGDFFAVAAGNDVAETTPDQHDDGNGTNDAESDAGDLIKNAVRTDEFGWHTVGTGSFSAFLSSEGHSFAGTEREGGADAGDNL